MVNGETHYFLGWRYRLRVHEQNAPALVAIRGLASLDLFVRPGSSAGQRETVLLSWHRAQLKALIPPLLERGQPILAVQAAHWGVKKMKTKWGSCNAAAARLWFNLELAKKPVQCLKYIVVHELERPARATCSATSNSDQGSTLSAKEAASKVAIFREDCFTYV
jgi:predicted metal-dependent hydrolase